MIKGYNDIFDFLIRNNIDLVFGKDTNNKYYCEMKYKYGETAISNGDVVRADTPLLAFYGMCDKFSGQMLEFPKWVDDEYKPVKIQFPALIEIVEYKDKKCIVCPFDKKGE